MFYIALYLIYSIVVS